MTEQGPYFHREENAPPNSIPLLVFIEERAVENERASSEAGQPIFDQAVFLRVVAPGQRNGSPIYEIRRTLPDGKEKIDQQVYRRFKHVYEQWKDKQTPATSGTPLEQWPLMTVALVAAFKHANIYTVQQLAELSDGFLENLKVPKAREWRGKAQAWLTHAKEAGADVEARATIERQQSEIDELRAMVAQLQQKNNGLGFDKRSRKRSRSDGDDMVVIPDDASLQDGERL